jgi:hypothetical protein
MKPHRPTIFSIFLMVLSIAVSQVIIQIPLPSFGLHILMCISNIIQGVALIWSKYEKMEINADIESVTQEQITHAMHPGTPVVQYNGLPPSNLPIFDINNPTVPATQIQTPK